MTQDQFFKGMDDLCMVFEHDINPKLSKYLFDRLQHHHPNDWLTAVEDVLGNSTRRPFPRYGELKEALQKAMLTRETKEHQERKGTRDDPAFGKALDRIDPSESKTFLSSMDMGTEAMKAYTKDYLRRMNQKVRPELKQEEVPF